MLFRFRRQLFQRWPPHLWIWNNKVRPRSRHVQVLWRSRANIIFLQFISPKWFCLSLSKGWTSYQNHCHNLSSSCVWNIVDIMRSTQRVVPSVFLISYAKNRSRKRSSLLKERYLHLGIFKVDVKRELLMRTYQRRRKHWVIARYSRYTSKFKTRFQRDKPRINKLLITEYHYLVLLNFWNAVKHTYWLILVWKHSNTKFSKNKELIFDIRNLLLHVSSAGTLFWSILCSDYRKHSTSFHVLDVYNSYVMCNH